MTGEAGSAASANDAGSNPAGPGPASGRAGTEFHVGEIGMRIPGTSAGFGRRVAERALELVAEQLPIAEAGELDRITLRVSTRATSEAALSHAVAEALVKALGRRR